MKLIFPLLAAGLIAGTATASLASPGERERHHRYEQGRNYDKGDRTSRRYRHERRERSEARYKREHDDYGRGRKRRRSDD